MILNINDFSQKWPVREIFSPKENCLQLEKLKAFSGIIDFKGTKITVLGQKVHSIYKVQIKIIFTEFTEQHI